MVVMKRSTFASILAGGVLSAAAPVSAQSYPSKTIMMLSWSAAGSPVDVMARQAARLARKYSGQEMIVEDKTGGGTANALAYLTAQPADGYTILAVTDSLIVSLNTTLKGKFTLDQFDFVGQLAVDPYVIAVASGSPIKTWADFVKASKTSNVTIGGAFAESAESFFAREMGATAGIKFQWVPYSGGAPAVAAALGQHTTAVCTNVSAVASFAAAGQLRVIAVSTPEPTNALPGTPTFASLGYKTLVDAHWRGIATRSGLPADVRTKLVAFTRQVAQDGEFKSFCDKVHLHDEYADPNALAEIITRQNGSVQKILAGGVGG
jgi:tripartite-type tricarboxylate transporter receptor subunit TctC